MDLTKNLILPHLLSIRAEQGDIEMIKAAHKLCDDLLEKSGLHKQTTCKKGCSFCCHDEILMTKFEAALILEYVKKNNIKPNRELVKKQNAVDEYKSLKWKDQACAMLKKDGTCSIYPVRPQVCRTHNSIGDVKLCDKRIDPNSTVPEGRILEAEAIQFALMEMQDLKTRHDMMGMHHTLKDVV